MPILEIVKASFDKLGIRLPKWLTNIFSKPKTSESYIHYERIIDLPPTNVLTSIQIECETPIIKKSLGIVNHGYIH